MMTALLRIFSVIFIFAFSPLALSETAPIGGGGGPQAGVSYYSPVILSSYFGEGDGAKDLHDLFSQKLENLLKKNPQLRGSKKAVEHALAFYYKKRDGGLNTCGGDSRASSNLSNQKWISVIDYTVPNTEARGFFIDLETNEVISDRVAHGKFSGHGQPIPTQLSDENGSKKTNGGFFETRNIYTSVGGDGEPKKTFGGKSKNAIKLVGLVPGNRRSFSPRGIVFHGATYVNSQRAGNSWGCPAVQVGTFNRVKNDIDEGSLMYLHTIEQDKLDAPEC